MNDESLREILTTSNTIASVGVSSNPEKDSYGVVYYLRYVGYRIFPVNPTASQIFNEIAYPDLSSIPEKIDVVQIFRPASEVIPVVEEAIQIGAKVIWMQIGTWNLEAAEIAYAAGLKVVMNRCMRTEHFRLVGLKMPEK
jgi:predicted CoA-binding protein